MVAAFANAMMSAQADQVCGGGYGARSGLVARRLAGVQLATADAHPRLVAAIGATTCARC